MANRMSIAGPSVSAGSGSDVPPLHTVAAATGSSAKACSQAATPRSATTQVRDGRGRRRARRHDGASARSPVRRRNAPPRRARRMAGGASSAFFSRVRPRSMLRRWTEMPKRSRTSSTRSAAVSSGCSRFAACSASTTSSLSLWGRRGPGRSGSNPGSPPRLPGALRLIPGRARDAEARSGMAHRHAVLAHAAQHLVLDLEQIARVEERVRQEQLVAHRLRVRVQAAVLLEGSGLASAGRLAIARAPSRKECKSIYAPSRHRIKPRLLLFDRK